MLYSYIHMATVGVKGLTPTQHTPVSPLAVQCRVCEAALSSPPEFFLLTLILTCGVVVAATVSATVAATFDPVPLYSPRELQWIMQCDDDATTRRSYFTQFARTSVLPRNACIIEPLCRVREAWTRADDHTWSDRPGTGPRTSIYHSAVPMSSTIQSSHSLAHTYTALTLTIPSTGALLTMS